MYTRCPECHTPYRVNPRLLRAGAEGVLCGHCQLVFNAGAYLEVSVPEAESSVGVPLATHVPVAEHGEVAATPVVPRWRLDGLDESDSPDGPAQAGGRYGNVRPRRNRARPRSRSTLGDEWRWGLGAAALTGLLIVQAFYFEKGHLAQNPLFRPWLDGVCGSLGCSLPPFRDLANVKILDRGLGLAAGRKDAFEFSLSFANQSPLPQAYPKLKLTLNELGGRPIAERVFAPIEYLPDWQEDALMPIGTPVEVRFSFAKPSRDIGGFGIEFQ